MNDPLYRIPDYLDKPQYQLPEHWLWVKNVKGWRAASADGRSVELVSPLRTITVIREDDTGDAPADAPIEVIVLVAIANGLLHPSVAAQIGKGS